jgi:NAD-dependent SIR2 family protein deacetylase
MILSDTTWLQVENTTKCNAWCPACGRNQNGYEINPDLIVEDLPTSRFEEVLKKLPELKTIQFCGTYGDTMAAANVLPDIANEIASQPYPLCLTNCGNGVKLVHQ